MKLDEIYDLKLKLEKAEKIKNSVNEIDRTVELLNQFGSEIVDITMSYPTLGVKPFSPSYEEELIEVNKPISPEVIGINKDEFSKYFRELVLAGLVNMKEELLKELGNL